MRALATVAVALVLASCASPQPILTASPSGPLLVCLEVPNPTCEAVADAARALTGTAPLFVEALPLPADGGMTMKERFLVSLAPEPGGDERQLAEVVRFAGTDDWSVRRVEEAPES